jgi:hypothetical protein
MALRLALLLLGLVATYGQEIAAAVTVSLEGRLTTGARALKSSQAAGTQTTFPRRKRQPSFCPLTAYRMLVTSHV